MSTRILRRSGLYRIRRRSLSGSLNGLHAVKPEELLDAPLWPRLVSARNRRVGRSRGRDARERVRRQQEARRTQTRASSAANGTAQTHHGRPRGATATASSPVTTSGGESRSCSPGPAVWAFRRQPPCSDGSRLDGRVDPRDDLVEHLVERGRGLEAEHLAWPCRVSGTRRWTSYSKRVVVARSRSGTSSPLTLRQISSASSSTVVDSAVERLKSSLRASGCSIAVDDAPGEVAAVGVVPHLVAVAEDVQRVLALEHLLHQVGDDVAHRQLHVAGQRPRRRRAPGPRRCRRS